MQAWQNIVLQVFGSVIQIANVAGQVPFGGGKTQPLIALGAGVIQALAGIVAHWYNPDGTSAKAAYNPAK